MLERTPPRSGSQLAWLLPVAIAAAIGGFQLAQRHALFGVQQYDDGAYLGGALQLVAGRLPYKDFAFVQPPGVALLLAPVVAFGHLTSLRDAVALSRMLTVAASVADVALTARLVRHRGAVASIVAGGVLALYPATFSADRAFLVEPWLDLLCLAGATLALSRDDLSPPSRLLFAGIAIGLAGTLKAMAIVALAVLVVAVLPRVRGGVLAVVGGALIGFGVPALPFFVASPAAFVHDVVTTQLARSAATTTPIAARLSFLLGTRQNGIGPSGIAGADSLAKLVAIALIAVVGLLLGVPVLAGKGTRLEGFVLLAAAATGASMLLPQIYYAHYGYFFAPFLALSLGLSADRVVRGAARFVNRIGGPGLSGSLVAGVGLLLVAALAAGGTRLGIGVASFAAARISKAGDPGPLIEEVLPARSCAISDAAILLITANRYDTSSGCPAVVDATGAWLVADPAHPERATGPRSPVLVADWEAWFAKASYVVLSSPETFRIPWTPALRADFEARYVLVSTRGAYVYRRIGA